MKRGDAWERFPVTPHAASPAALLLAMCRRAAACVSLMVGEVKPSLERDILQVGDFLLSRSELITNLSGTSSSSSPGMWCFKPDLGLIFLGGW